jgi:hypothetical protein
MDITKKKKAFEMLAELKLLQQDIVSAIMEEIDTIQPLKDVTPISPNICTIKLSTIQKNGGILSPEYYIADVQKEEIKKHLSKCGNDIEKITVRIKDMIDKGRIKGSSADKDIRLNKNSIEVLKMIYAEISE